MSTPLPPVTHFNHAGASIPTLETLQAVMDHLHRESELGAMEAAATAKVAARLAEGYRLAAALLGCSPEEIAFGVGHGQLYGDIVAALPLKEGDRILVSRQEWIGNLLALRHAAEKAGAVIDVMPSDPGSAVDVEAVKSMLSAEVKVVALTWVGAGSPLVNPAAALGCAIRDVGSTAIYLVDASQALGQLPVAVRQIQCDALVACGRKFVRGPRGTALSYLSRTLNGRLRPQRVDNLAARLEDDRAIIRPDARAFEFAEYPLAQRLGLIQAMEQLLELGVNETSARLKAIASRLRDELQALSGVTVLDLGREKAALVSFQVDGVSCDRVKAELAKRGIAIGKNGIDYTPIDMRIRGIQDLLRASIHLTTSDQDVERLVSALMEIVANSDRSKEPERVFK